MNEIHRIATKYFIELESFSAYGGKKNKYFWWLGIILFIIFIASTYFFELIYFTYNTLNIKNSNILMLLILSVAISLEIWLLFTFFNIQEYKEKLIIKKFNMDYKIDDISVVKIQLLKKYFSIEQDKFMYKAKEINEMLRLNDNKFKNKHPVDKFFYFIFNNESKNRVLSLFILMCSISTIIFLKSYETNNFLENINNLTIYMIKKYFFSSLFLSIMLYITMFLSYKIIRKIIIFVSVFFVTKKSENIEIVKYLISDLIKYHVFSKPKIKPKVQFLKIKKENNY